MIHVHLLNTAVDSQPVIFMHHIISGRQLHKTVDLAALIGGAFFLFLFFTAKNITLGDNHKFNQRILITPMCIPVGHQKFPRLHQTFFFFRVKRA